MSCAPWKNPHKGLPALGLGQDATQLRQVFQSIEKWSADPCEGGGGIEWASIRQDTPDSPGVSYTNTVFSQNWTDQSEGFNTWLTIGENDTLTAVQPCWVYLSGWAEFFPGADGIELEVSFSGALKARTISVTYSLDGDSNAYTYLHTNGIYQLAFGGATVEFQSKASDVGYSRYRSQFDVIVLGPTLGGG